MKKCMVYIALTSLVYGVQANQDKITLEPHQVWWQKNYAGKLDQFENWLGDQHAQSRVVARQHVIERQYTSILDIPCGFCAEFFGYTEAGYEIAYTAADITPLLIERAQRLGIPAVQANIEALPFESSSFDICYARHILEHLCSYQAALDELIRVASKEVLVVFFITPHTESNDDKISLEPFNDALLYHNRYSQYGVQQYLLSHQKVTSFEWETVNKGEIILHVYLNYV